MKMALNSKNQIQIKSMVKFNIFHSDIKLLSINIEVHSNDFKALEKLMAEFVKSISNYDRLCKEYLDYLARTNTAECIEEVQRVSSEIISFTEKVEADLKMINNYINELRVVENESSFNRE